MMTRIGVVQAGSVLGDTPRTLDKLSELCEACARRHLQVAVFPEAFIGGYPKGLASVPRSESAPRRAEICFGRMQSVPSRYPAR